MTCGELVREECLWEHLKSCEKSILMYGTGNGGDKILDECISRGIKISGVFASSGFVRHRVWRDMEVLSYDEAIRQYGNDIVVLLAFGSALPDVTENFHMLDERHEFYIPDVPLFGGEVFDRAYCTAHESEISAAAEIFADDESRELYFDILRFRLTGKMKYLCRTVQLGKQAAELLRYDGVKNIIDCGAYKGDTAEIFKECFTNAEYILAMEPDPSSFRKLSEYCDKANSSSSGLKTVPLNSAVGDSDRTEAFLCTGSRGSGRRGQGRVKSTVTEVCRIDTAASDLDVDFIKMDVEGDEEAALRGAHGTISRCDCALAISVYHKTDDLYRLPMMIHEMYPHHRLYLRREACVPAWDITLWAVPERLVNRQ